MNPGSGVGAAFFVYGSPWSGRNKSTVTDPSGDMAALIRRIESQIDTRALPEELFLFISRITPLINVDLLIQDYGKGTLLTWRSDRFFGPGWHVPGGIIRHKEWV